MTPEELDALPAPIREQIVRTLMLSAAVLHETRTLIAELAHTRRTLELGVES